MWYFEIVKGKILGFFPILPNGKYKIIEVKQIRSPEQNRLYWGYIIKFIVIKYEEAGIIHSKDFIHKQFKKTFLPKFRIKDDFKKKYKYVLKYGSTKKLTKPKFSEFIGKIKIFCEHGVLGEIGDLESLQPFVIPEINEEELLNWIDKIV